MFWLKTEAEGSELKCPYCGKGFTVELHTSDGYGYYFDDEDKALCPWGECAETIIVSRYGPYAIKETLPE